MAPNSQGGQDGQGGHLRAKLGEVVEATLQVAPSRSEAYFTLMSFALMSLHDDVTKPLNKTRQLDKPIRLTMVCFCSQGKALEERQVIVRYDINLQL